MNPILFCAISAAVLAVSYYYIGSFFILFLVCGLSLAAWYFLAANVYFLFLVSCAVLVAWYFLSINFFFLFLACSAALAAWYAWYKHKLNTPSLQWPYLGMLLGLEYCAEPPRLSGNWEGRKVAFEAGKDAATITA